jgi:hypothetical protein
MEMFKTLFANRDPNDIIRMAAAVFNGIC